MSRPIRVLSIIGELLLGGGENRLLSLARSIDRSRFEHRVVVLNRADRRIAERDAMPQMYAEAGIIVIELEKNKGPSTARAKSISLMKRVRRLSEIIEAHDVDVIDAHMETAALAGTIAGILTRRPVCVTLYHAEPLVRPSWWGIARQLILTAPDLLVTDSALRADEIRRAALLGRPSVVVVPNGVWIPRAVRTEEEMRTMLNIPPRPEAMVIGQISAFAEFKGQMVLLDAARKVLREQRGVYFLLAGYTSHESDFRQRVEQRALELDIADRVRILNYPGPIGDIWQIIDIHAHASVFDSLPQSILEGMSLAKPAVVTAVGGVPEAVTDGTTGLVVEPGNSTALANGISTLVRAPALGRKLGDAAFVRYSRRYRPEQTARALEGYFEELAGRRSEHSLQWKQLKDALY